MDIFVCFCPGIVKDITKNENQFLAIEISNDVDDEIVTKTFEIGNPLYGFEIDVTYHMDYDQDGQIFVKTKRISDWRA